MAFATAADVSQAMGQEFDAASTGMAEALLEGVTGQIASACDKTDDWAAALDPVPAALKFLTVCVAIRAMANPAGSRQTQETLGAYSYAQSFATDGPLLSDKEESLARRIVYGTATVSTAELASVIDMIPFEFPTAGAWVDLAELGSDDPVGYLPAVADE